MFNPQKIIEDACRRSQPKTDWKVKTIGIRDVLIAMNKNSELRFAVSIYPDGQIISCDDVVDDEKIYWDLIQDSLEYQNLQTKEKIARLLIAKEL